MARLNLTNLETVCTIARLGTFAAAGLRLHASQPAVTARVRELEESLGFALFQKRGRRMELTTRGRHFIDRVQPLVDGIEREAAAHAAADAAVGVVRLGIPMVWMDRMPPVIAGLKEEMPRLEFEVDVDAGMSIVQKLQAGKLDVVVTASRVHDDALHAVTLRPEVMRWMAAADAGGAATSLAELLATRPVWVVSRGSTMFARAAEALREAWAGPVNMNTCANMAGILQMVLHTRGIGLIVDSLAQAHVARGTLRPLPLPPVPLEITLLAHKDQQQDVVGRVVQRIVEFDNQRALAD